jgi:hypothetical protein
MPYENAGRRIAGSFRLIVNGVADVIWGGATAGADPVYVPLRAHYDCDGRFAGDDTYSQARTSGIVQTLHGTARIGMGATALVCTILPFIPRQSGDNIIDADTRGSQEWFWEEHQPAAAAGAVVPPTANGSSSSSSDSDDDFELLSTGSPAAETTEETARRYRDAVAARRHAGHFREAQDDAAVAQDGDNNHPRQRRAHRR